MRYVYYAAVLGITYFFAINGNVFTLFLKRLGAGNTQIGMVLSLLQLAAVVQIFIARMIEHRGKKRFIIGGWLVATTISIGYLAVPLLARRYGSSTAVYILMAMVVPVALARQVAIPGWMPLLNDLVPSDIRGRFFAKMRTIWQLASIAFLIFASLFFAGTASAPFWRYQVIFVIGIVASFARVAVIAKIPEPAPPAADKAPSVWSTINLPFADSVYVRFVAFSALVTVALAMTDSYTVVYLKSAALDYDDSHALFVSTGIFFMGSAAALIFWGILADKVGSRPLLVINTLGMGLVRFLWIPAAYPGWGKLLIPLFFLLNGVFAAGFGIANTKYLFSITPRRFGKASYIVMANVAITLVAAAFTPLGGFVIDGLSAYSADLARYGLDEYRLPFLASGVMVIIASVLIARFKERDAVPTREVLWTIVARPAQTLYNLFLFRRPLSGRMNGRSGRR